MIEKLIQFIKDFKSFIEENNLEIIYDKEILDWEIIKKIVKFYVTYDNGMCLVDFIDQANWDNVDTHVFTDDSRTLELVWRDYTKIEENIHDERIRKSSISYFGSSKTLLYISIDSICISKHKYIPTVLIKGYYKDKRQINHELNTKCSGFELQHDGLFSKSIAKLVKHDIHRVTVPIINCYTISLVPKYAHHIDVIDSKNFLYDANINASERKMLDIIKIIDKLDGKDVNKIMSVGNQLRREFEHVLKVFFLRHHQDYKLVEENTELPEKDIQQLMLGQLTKILEKSKSGLDKSIKLELAIDFLNKCSHSSGVPLTKGELVVAWSVIYVVVLEHTQWINNKINS